MEAGGDDASTKVTLFLDGDALYANGEAGAVEHVLAELLGPDESQRRRSATTLADAGAAAATVGTVGATAEVLLRPTAQSLQKLREFGGQFDGSGALRGYVRSDGGTFAGNLSFEAVTFGAEQALALQTAAVSLALRSAIADVQAAVEAVDRKVSDIQKRIRAREIGEIVGTYRFLQRVVESTRARGRLLDADWDQVAGARRDLEIALESLQGYVTESVNDIDSNDPLPKRESAIGRIADPKGVAGSLRLILVAQQALHLLEYLRLERIRTTDPHHAPAALTDAKRALADQRERDAALVQQAAARIEAAKLIGPLEVHRFFSINDMRKTSAKALDVLELFASAARAELPTLDRSVRRPHLVETRAEVKRHALNATNDVIGASRTVGHATSRGARQISETVRRKTRDLLD
ncbi:hypothetical protein Val02_91530 [Virgisporangium aliadipatigenens]|uniref:Uncharacterized protein n=1 Tax=Virgisporangium aliadipatigenens TaxID=741659 RepID=A0A8J3YXC2_9ACTN|nr:hypothetical protein [Virgisporangium aliadipatigenens]GIJ52267.1 hypothetical protein Val02_91530 [Virgisporangium aliadipatigenens]